MATMLSVLHSGWVAEGTPTPMTTILEQVTRVSKHRKLVHN